MTTKARRALRRLAWWLHLVDQIDETHRYRQGPVLSARVCPVDPVDVAYYGEVLHEAAHGGGSCGCDTQPLVRKQFDKGAQALLAQLAADGRFKTRQ